MAFAVIGLAVALVGALVGLVACWTRSTRLRRRFSAIVDVEAEVARLRAEGARLRAAAAEEAESIHRTVRREREPQAIAEEQRRIREQMGDEEKALREAESAKAAAEEEEVRFQNALEKAKVELSSACGEEHACLGEAILELHDQLAEARAKREYRESAAMRLARGSGPAAAPSLPDQVAMGSALAKLSRSPREERPDAAASLPRRARPS